MDTVATTLGQWWRTHRVGPPKLPIGNHDAIRLWCHPTPQGAWPPFQSRSSLRSVTPPSVIALRTHTVFSRWWSQLRAGIHLKWQRCKSMSLESVSNSSLLYIIMHKPSSASSEEERKRGVRRCGYQENCKSHCTRSVKLVNAIPNCEHGGQVI